MLFMSRVLCVGSIFDATMKRSRRCLSSRRGIFIATCILMSLSSRNAYNLQLVREGTKPAGVIRPIKVFYYYNRHPFLQVVLESRRECAEAQRLLGMIRGAFPEVLTAIKTKQLAQEILLNKEEHIGEVAKTGAIKRHCP